MSKPAARVGDMHICPLSTGKTPHIGGAILPPGYPSVLIEGLPAARSGDKAICTGSTDTIIGGSATVFIGNQAVARVGDQTVHGGVITTGSTSVLIGG